jgi:plastocyanin
MKESSMRKVTLFATVAALLAGIAVSHGADITGKVKFDGKAPRGRLIKMDSDPYCVEHHGDKKPRSEEVLVNENGTLKNVLVFIRQAPAGKKYDPPTEAVVLDQEGCTYHPRVFGVQAGQPITIRNSDNTLHNVNISPKENSAANFAQPKKGDQREHKFGKVEIVVPFKCDVHPWMGAYCGVFDHPFFSVTGDEGSFSLKGLPAGKYTVEAWHEKLGTQTMEVTVGDADTKEIEFTFKPAAE